MRVMSPRAGTVNLGRGGADGSPVLRLGASSYEPIIAGVREKVEAQLHVELRTPSAGGGGGQEFGYGMLDEEAHRGVGDKR